MRRNDSRNRLRSWAFGVAIPLAALALAALSGDSALAWGVREKVLHSFCNLTNCADGANPTAGLIADSAGILYDTTPAGSKYLEGAVFKLTGTGFVPPSHASP